MAKLGVALGALFLLVVTACVPEELGGTFVIVNSSDAPVYLSTKRIAPNGGRYFFGVRTCIRPGFQLRDRRGRIVVTLQEEACAGDALTVYGPNDYTLETTGE